VVRSSLPPEDVRLEFPSKSKIGPGDRIDDLVRVAVPGVELKIPSGKPPEIPFTGETSCFELDRSGDLWRQIEDSGSLAIHVTGEFPLLEMDLWAIKN